MDCGLKVETRLPQILTSYLWLTLQSTFCLMEQFSSEARVGKDSLLFLLLLPDAPIQTKRPPWPPTPDPRLTHARSRRWYVDPKIPYLDVRIAHFSPPFLPSYQVVVAITSKYPSLPAPLVHCKPPCFPLGWSRAVLSPEALFIWQSGGRTRTTCAA